MARVLFVQANYDIDKLTEVPWMPIALVELATFIREKGHEVKILDRNLHYDNSLLIKTLRSFSPDVVGMTCYTSYVIKDIKQTARIVKENSSALVIIGGVHATLEPKSLLGYSYIDYVVRGEGELPLLEICNLIDKKKATNKNINKIKNVNYNEMRPFINLDILPASDYSLLAVKKYPVATFYTSRGCPGKCTFCYNLGRQLRFYNAKKTIDTITLTLDKYNIKEFTIADDNFANLSKRTTDICNTLARYNVVFHCFLRVDQVYDQVMQNLKKAGCWAIQFGFESGSQRILNLIQKGITVQQNINAIKQCKKYKIFVDGSFMAGLPTETTEDMLETVNFIKKYKPDAVDIKVFKPYPCTQIFEESVAKGLIKKPSTLEEWEHFCDLKEGNINLSKIPTPILLETVNKLSRTSYPTYLKKALLLIFGGHFSYTLFKAKKILKSKLYSNVA